MKINIRALVQLLDNHESRWGGHTTSIIGLVGEDINTEIFVDYLKRRKGIKAEVLPDPVNQGTRRGKRLDRWIKAGSIYYQAEIKNWCSFKIGGFTLPLDATEQKKENLAKELWIQEKKIFWGRKAERDERISKVLSRMKEPAGFSKNSAIKPLIIHWMPISNKKLSPFFSVPIKDLNLSKNFQKKVAETSKFHEVNYFSSSLYLRELIKSSERTLDLDLPNVKIRISALKTFISL